MANWRESTWGEEVTLEYGKALRGYSPVSGRYRVFGSNGQAGWTDEPLVDGPGVILGRKGAYRGVQFCSEPFYVIDTAYYVRPKTDLDMRWLYYAIQYHKLGEIDDGSPIPSTTRSAVYVRDFTVPPPSYQRRMASVLAALDDKIELNRRMNETLDAIARAIFKDWFVDFGPTRARMEGRRPYLAPDIWALFPDRLNREGKPEGWQSTRLGELCSRIAIGPFGSNITTDNFVAEGVPVIRGGNLRSGFNDDNFVFVSEQKADDLSNANVVRGDVILTHRGTLGQVGIVPSNSRFSRYVISQSQMFLRVDTERASPRFIYEFLRSPDGERQLLANTSQTGVPAISRPTTSLKTLELTLPPLRTIQNFEKVAAPLSEKAEANIAEIGSLIATRDILLPKLMSGEIRISDAEAMVAAAA